MYEGAITATNGVTDDRAVPVPVTVAPTITPERRRLDRRVAPLRRCRRGGGAGELALRQRLDLRRQRLDVALEVGDLAVLLVQRRQAGARRDAVPVRHHVGQRDQPAGHRPRHAPLRSGSCADRRPALLCGDQSASIDTVGGSPNAYLGSGTWGFNTATGGPEEVVAGPAFAGPERRRATRRSASTATSSTCRSRRRSVRWRSTRHPSTRRRRTVGTGTFDVTVESSLDLTGLSADAFGLSQPESVHVNPKQDDSSESDPSSASVKVGPITIGDHASRATFTFPDVLPDEDIDMFVVYDEQRRAVHQRRDRRLVRGPCGPERVGDPDRSGERQLPGVGVRLPGQRRRQCDGEHRRDRHRAGQRHRDRQPAERATRREHALHAAPELQRRRRPRRLRG